LIRLSLLPTSHPLGFQPKWVRSSTRYNSRFNLLMGRSPSFASTTCDDRPIKTRFPWGSGPEDLNQAAYGNSPDHYAKGTPSHLAFNPGYAPSKLDATPERHSAPTACRRMVSGSVTSPSGGSFHLSVALLGSLSVVREYLALRDGPRRFSRGST
jgi:hypothetical protein